MDLSLFDFELPESLIAQTPAGRRDESRLLVVDRNRRTVSHEVFREIGRFLPERSLLFRNNARVLPARLLARRPTGGAVECLLLHPSENPMEWWCLVRPGRKLPPGSTFFLENAFHAEVLAADPSGKRKVRFHLDRDATVPDLANRLGQMPLPPYIRREKSDPRSELDRERYQTVYADAGKQVAAAAPTAGLHFTPELIESLEGTGHRFAEITLHIGLGTFQPIQAERIEDHRIHTELYEIPVETQQLLRRPESRARVAVGTTAVRAIEDYFTKDPPGRGDSGAPGSFQSEASIYIYPPRNFAGVDSLITNFHLPRSTLLCLVAAFLTPGSSDGISWLREIYAEAIAREYRFFSYGDAMLIL